MAWGEISRVKISGAVSSVDENQFPARENKTISVIFRLYQEFASVKNVDVCI